MPTTQDIEAGLAPPGIGSPEPTPQLRLTPPPEVPYRPPTQVVDRQAYLTAQQQAAAQAQIDRINEIQRRFVNPVRQAYQQVPSLLEQENARSQIANLPDAQRRIAEAQLAANQPINVQGVDRTIYRGPAPLNAPSVGLTGLAAGIGRAAAPLTTEIPGAETVANVVGDVARNVANVGLLTSGGPLGTAVDIGVNKALGAAGLPQPSNIVRGALSNTAGFIAETLIPTEVWQAALELTPAGFTGGVPALARAVRKGSPEAIAALTRAGEKLGAREEVQTALKQIGAESGALKFGKKAAPEAAPEVITNAERVAQLTEQQKNIRQMITTLSAPEANRALTGNVKTVLDIAERYPADSPARQDLLKVLEPKIAALEPLDQKIIRETLAALPSKEARQAATTAQRASQAARTTSAYEETPGTVVEKTRAAFEALRGKQAQRFEPLGSKFTDAEQGQLYDRIDQAWRSGKIGTFERNNLVDAMNLLMTGTRINTIRPNNLAPYEISGLGKVFGPEVEAAIAKSPARYLSNFDKFVDVLNLPRALVTAFDISAAGRQGILLTARNPIEASKSLWPMFKAMGSEEGFRKTSQNIVNNPKFQDGVAHGLWLSDIGGGGGAEEAFISHLAGKLPFVRGSERGYVTYLDNMRMLNYEKMSNRLEQFAATHDGWDVARTDAVKSQVASFLNHATGRGDLKAMDKFVPALNAVFFSPRYFASRFQTVWDMVRPGADSYTRKVAFENLGAFVGTGMAALAALKMTGAADVEMDPRSADFGRIKIGPTRIDFWGGYQPIARYIAQISTGHVKNTSTGVTAFANPGDSAMRFFRSKLSPAGSMVYDYIPGKQKDYAGNDLIINPRDLGPNKETGALAWNTFATKLLPLSIQDAINGYQTQGLGGAAAAGAVSALGGGVSSYEPTEKQKATKAKIEGQSALDQGGFTQLLPNLVNANTDNIATALGYPASEIQGKSWEEIKAKYVADDQAQYEQEGKSQTEAKYLANRDWAGFDVVKQIEKAKDEDQLNWWKAHPDQLKQAIDSGATQPSKEKMDILKAAGLMK